MNERYVKFTWKGQVGRDHILRYVTKQWIKSAAPAKKPQADSNELSMRKFG